ncbi:MAG TPA: DUF167 domain-containing protein [Candidatus Binataceae bacterium]|nr:DUF167 domain-containing protein [Candidatus Binataceae bacterium]
MNSLRDKNRSQRVAGSPATATEVTAVGAATRPPWLITTDNSVTIQIVARPGSSRRGIARQEPRGLIIALHSPPEKGRANDELIDYLAALLGTPRTAIAIVRGHTGRVKTVRIMTRDSLRVAGILLGAIP